jgi:hypothetical protein
MYFKIGVGAGILAVVALTGCGGGSNEAPQPQPEAKAQTFTLASRAQLDHIAYFLEDDWVPTTGPALRNAYTVPSDVTEGGHFFAAEFATAPGFVGVWWHAGTPATPGMVLAVDGRADEACVCQWAKNTRAGDLWAKSDGAQKLRAHAEAQIDR